MHAFYALPNGTLYFSLLLWRGVGGEAKKGCPTLAEQPYVLNSEFIELCILL